MLIIYLIIDAGEFFCIKYARLLIFTDLYSSILSLYGRIRVSEKPYSRIFSYVCIYYKESLLIKVLSIHYLQDCICFDLKISSKTCNIISPYRSPSQTVDEFDESLTNSIQSLESINQTNPAFISCYW